MRVITFSRQFPAYHPKAGQETEFIARIWQYLNYDIYCFDHQFGILEALNPGKDSLQLLKLGRWHTTYAPKLHTIRSGNRWNPGDKFSPRVWSGKPYRSKQIIIAPDIEIKKVWRFEIKVNQISEDFYMNGTLISELNNYIHQWWNIGIVRDIAKNDGLLFHDFLDWFKFPQPFQGQIIAWDENVNY